VIGGRLDSIGTNARLGKGEFLVAEADESDASFLYLQPVVSVVTNIDADHMETYGHDFERLKGAFVEFLGHLPFYGLAVVCKDDEHARAIMKNVSRPMLTYGIRTDADLRAQDVRWEAGGMRFRAVNGGPRPLEITLNLPGEHNVLNALAAIAVAAEVGVDEAAILRGLAGFAGIGRRFQMHGELQLAQGRVTVIDDYGHHPREIAATLQAVRAGWPERRVVLAFQPHRYSRTRDLFEDFAEVLSEVDLLLLAEVYPAGEEPLPGADSRALCRAIRARGKLDPVFVSEPLGIGAVLSDLLADGDLLLVMGAGDIGQLPAQLPAQLGSLDGAYLQEGAS
jgi:UDP-N-acetylmuramate--alanine ligase